MATARAVWVWPGAWIDVEIDAQDRIRSATVFVPDGYTARVTLTDGATVYSRDFAAGSTVVPTGRPIPQDSVGYTIGMSVSVV